MSKKKNGRDDSSTEHDELNEGNFGLPDIEYKPLDPLEDYSVRDEDTITTPEPDETQYTPPPVFSEERPKRKAQDDYPILDEPEEKSSSSWLWIILLILFLIGGAFIMYKYFWVPYKHRQELARVKAETAATQKKQAEEQAAAASEKATENNANTNSNTSKNSNTNTNSNTGVSGTMEEVTAATGHYYLVVASSIDSDLLKDYATKLQQQGHSLKVITPYGKVPYTRVAVGDYGQLSEAKSALESIRQQFGTEAWILRY